MKNKDRKAKLSSAYHEFSIHRRLFWLVSFLRFAIPCCDFPHDELSWRKSWDDDLNLEVIQQLYILTASFAPEHRINIQWNQSCQHDRRHLLFSRVSNEIQGISNRIVRMRDISLLCCTAHHTSALAQSAGFLIPNINIRILFTIVLIFLMLLVGRIWLKSKTLDHWWSFSLFSWPVCFIK